MGNDTDLISTVVEELDRAISASISRCTADLEGFGVLFSAGLDSTLVAKISEDLGKEVVLYSVGLEGSQDQEYVREAGKTLRSPIKRRVIDPDEVEAYVRKVIETIGGFNPLDVSIGIPFYIACEMARDDGVLHVLCGQGADELFAGYYRYLAMSMGDLQAALVVDVEKARRSADNRDHLIARANSLELITPFLDPDLVRVALKISPDLKIHGGVRKFVLREVAKRRGLPDSIVLREKKAIQYSTGVDKVLRKIAKRERLDLKSYCRDVFDSVIG